MKEYKIGRNPEADIILNANFCSRDHAKLTISESGKILLQDYSSNGTNVNGKKINNQTIEINYGVEVLFAGVENLDWSKVEKPEAKIVQLAQPNPVIQFIKPHFLKTMGALIVLALLVLLFNFINNHSNTKPETLLSSTEIYTRYQNAVAMVEVEYFVRIESSANDLYVGLDDSGAIKISNTKNDLKPLSSEGTAFYIDSSGLLVTNHHVIQPWHYDNKLTDYFNKVLKPLIIKALKSKGYMNAKPVFKGLLDGIYIYPNGKHFSHENRIECSIRKIANDDDIDLASIQINNHSLPPNATTISTTTTETDEKQIQVTTPAYVIGFPYGDELATNEENELKCSSTSGSFTQEPSKIYIQYSAQTASGGSGSPVFNQYGKLVAITYLGTLSGQSFNRKILVNYLRRVN